MYFGPLGKNNNRINIKYDEYLYEEQNFYLKLLALSG